MTTKNTRKSKAPIDRFDFDAEVERIAHDLARANPELTAEEARFLATYRIASPDGRKAIRAIGERLTGLRQHGRDREART